MREVQGRLLVVNQKHSNASDDNQGSEHKPLLTINAAARLAVPGDTVLVHEGVYREEVIPLRGGEEGKPITYLAAPDEKVYIRGSEIYKGSWSPTGANGIFTAQINKEMTGEYNPFRIFLINRLKEYSDKMEGAIRKNTLGQVFLDGSLLDEVDCREDLEDMPGTWLAEEDGNLLRVHFPHSIENPSKHQIELTVRKAVFRPGKRGLGYIAVKGFILEHAANQAITTFWENGSAPQQGLISCRSGHHWVVEDNIIRWAKSIGIDTGSERKVGVDLEGDPTPGYVGYHMIRNNTISDNGQGGLCGIGQIGTEIIGNIFERNNCLGAMAWEEAAIKTHFYINGRIEGNLIRDNYANGIWVDNVYQNIRISRNVILSNHGAGIFCEMGGSILIDNNIIGHSAAGNNGIGGNGIYAHDAGGITAVHNLIIENAKYGFSSTFANEREYNIYPQGIKSFDEPPVDVRPCDSSNSRIWNNIFTGNHQGALNLPFPNARARNNLSGPNLFCGSDGFLAFFVNSKSGVSLTEIENAMENAYDRAGIAVQDRSKPLQYGDGYMLTLEQWRLLLGNDTDSRVARMANVSWQMLHAGREPWVTFTIDESVEKAHWKRIEGIDQDFCGNAMPEDEVFPGPFQKVKKAGCYHVRLWPVRDRNQRS